MTAARAIDVDPTGESAHEADPLARRRSTSSRSSTGRFGARRRSSSPPAGSAPRRWPTAARWTSWRRRARSARATGTWPSRPPDYRDRRVEITGPTDRKLVINALNSGARGFMADFEDANSPTWANQVGGHVNLIDAIEGTIEYRSSDGKEYELVEHPGHAARPPARLAPAGEAPAPRRRAGSGLAVRLRPARLPLRPPAARARPAASSSTCPSSSTTSRRGCGTTSSPGPRTSSPPARHHARHRPDRDAARRVPDGRDPVRAARALPGPQRRPLGLHLLDDQVLPRPAGVRAPRPQRREDDRAVHARLRGAAGQDLPRARRLRHGRDGRPDPLPQGPGGQRARDRRRTRGQEARGRGGVRRHLGGAPRRRRRGHGGVRRRAGRQAEPDRAPRDDVAGRRRRASSTPPPPPATSPRRGCATTSTSASSTSRTGSAGAARRGSTT